MKKQILQRVTAVVIVVALVISILPVSVYASTSVLDVPWDILQELSDTWYGDMSDKLDATVEERQQELDKELRFIDNYLVEHPDATRWDAMKVYDDYMSGGHHSGGFGGNFDLPEPTQKQVDIHDFFKDKLLKIFANYMISQRNNYEAPPAFTETPIVRSSEGYYTYEKIINTDYVYFSYQPAGSTTKYTVRYYGFRLRYYDYNGVLQSTKTYCYNMDKCTQHFGAYAEGYDKMVFELSYDKEKNSLVYTYGFRAPRKDFYTATQYILLPSSSTWTDDNLPTFNPNIPDYYKITTTDDTNPIYYDPVTNNFYDQSKNIVNYNTFEMNPSDEEKQSFDDLINLIKQFRTAQIAGNVNIMQLLTDILTKLNTFDENGNSTCKDYSEILDKINASIIALAKNTSSSKVDLAPIISSLESLKQAVKEISVPNYSSKLNAAVNDLDSILKKLDTIIALLGVDVATNIFDALTDDESKKLDAFASVAAALLNILPSAVIGSTIVSLQSVFLTNSPPSDLTVTYQGEKITALSADMFSTSTQYIDMFKIFVSALLIYGWLLMMRRRISDVFT